jgi:hypothetical protein
MREKGSQHIWPLHATIAPVVWCALLCLVGASIFPARAEESDVPTSAPPAVRGSDSPEGGSAAPAPRARKSRSSKGKGPREKEADGTEARNRFKADPVLKSRYQLNGEPLEVDPD